MQEKLLPTDRNLAVDVARGLAIILVVYGHMARGMVELHATQNESLLQQIDFVLYTCHMPLFFLVSGFYSRAVLDARGFKAFGQGRVWAIVYPYVFWSMALYAVKSLTNLVLKVNTPVPLADLLAIPVRPISIFWFLYALCVIQLLSGAFRRRALAFLLLTLAADAAASLLMPDLLPPTANAIVAQISVHAPFFALGFLLQAQDRDLPFTRKEPAGWLLLVAMGSFALLVSTAVGLGLRHPVSLLTIPASLAGIAVFLLISRKIAASKAGRFFAFLGNRSFQIYILHIFFLPIVSRAAPALGMRSDVLVLSFATLFGVGGSVLVHALLKSLGLDGFFALSGRSPMAGKVFRASRAPA